jgi:BA14K-like protein
MRKFFMAVAATAALSTLGFAAPASAAQTAPVSELVAAIQDGTVKADYVQRRHYRGSRQVSRGGAYRGRQVYRGGVYRGGPRFVERGPYRAYRYGNYPRGNYGRGYGYYGPGYRNGYGYGSAAAAGAIGLATGAIVGGAMAQSNNSVSYCAQRFRSYDPSSGTYLGNDGRRHRCP